MIIDRSVNTVGLYTRISDDLNFAVSYEEEK